MSEEGKAVSLDKPSKKNRLTCEVCGKKILKEEALVHKNIEGKAEIICHECFEQATGVDYETFVYRREAARHTLVATVFCICVTIYAFVDKGPMWGTAGVIVTLLIFFFSAKVR